MPSTVVVTDQALRDLEEIHDYIARDKPRAAKNSSRAWNASSKRSRPFQNSALLAIKSALGCASTPPGTR